MRSSDGSPGQTTEASAAEFGALLTRLAKRAGFDVESGAGGRKKLAELMGMSVSAIGRNLDGVSLPRLSQFVPWARALNVPVGTLMVEGGLISGEDWPESVTGRVPSVAPDPEDVLDTWGIHDPMLRRMLLGNIEQTRQLQREADGQAGGSLAHKG